MGEDNGGRVPSMDLPDSSIFKALNATAGMTALTVNEYQQGPTPSAATKVFATRELLEQILSELPLVQIITAQRVSKYWKETVEGSLPLRRLVFFEPERPGPILVGYSHFLEEHKRQLLKQRGGGSFTANGMPPSRFRSLVIFAMKASRKVVQPQKLLGGHIELDALVKPTYTLRKLILNPTRITRQEWLDGVSLPRTRIPITITPSWRKMFVTQPPVMYMSFWHDEGPPSQSRRPWRRGNAATCDGFNIYNADGIKLSQLVDAIRDHLKTCEVSTKLGRYNVGLR